jgi:hypothetical protein
MLRLAGQVYVASEQRLLIEMEYGSLGIASICEDVGSDDRIRVRMCHPPGYTLVIPDGENAVEVHADTCDATLLNGGEVRVAAVQVLNLLATRDSGLFARLLDNLLDSLFGSKMHRVHFHEARISRRSRRGRQPTFVHIGEEVIAGCHRLAEVVDLNAPSSERRFPWIGPRIGHKCGHGH